MVATHKSGRCKRIGILSAAGLAGGLLAFCATLLMIFTAATSRLTTYAADLLREDQRIAEDISSTLRAGNASTDPPCSEADRKLLQILLFQSPYLKDVGRIRDLDFLCSAIADPVPYHRGFVAADVASYGTRRVWYNATLAVAQGRTAEIISEGRTDLVISPDLFANFDRPPMSYSVAVVDPAHAKIVKLYSDVPAGMPLQFLFHDRRLVRQSGMLYYPQCSVTGPDCVLTAMPMRAIWAPNYSVMIAGFAVGSLIGLLCSGVVMALRHRQRTLASQLRRAIKRRDLSVVYQPVVDLDTRRTVACEALVRWQDEDGDAVRPDVFIAIAEDEGFVQDITRLVLQSVLDEIGDLLRDGEVFRVTVNLSAYDLIDADFLPTLDAMLRERGIAPECVGLELTERSTADREHVIRTIRSLRERGHKVYIDDFGTGYSSLAYLHELSVDVLKVDRSFTNTIGTDSVTGSIVPQILEMAKVLKLKVVVEGVEEGGQAIYLREASRGLQVQGILFGRPMFAHELRGRLLGERAAEAAARAQL